MSSPCARLELVRELNQMSLVAQILLIVRVPTLQSKLTMVQVDIFWIQPEEFEHSMAE
jgi:hypothetical protein